MLAIAEQVGFDTFHLVGHDWGAAVGWKTVMDHPQKIRTWTALSIPHSGAFFDGLVNDTEQQKRSSYMDKLSLPLIPEIFYQLFKNRLYDSLKGLWHPHEIEEYRSHPK